jgi:hypothetical protein
MLELVDDGGVEREAVARDGEGLARGTSAPADLKLR